MKNIGISIHYKDIKKEVITQLKNEFPNWSRIPLESKFLCYL